MLLCLQATLATFLIAPRPVTAAVKVRQIITAEEAKDHIQETNIVCGFVVSGRYVDTSPTKPTYLNFERPYPNQAFTAVVPGALRPKFRVAPEELFKGRSVCVTGLITSNRDKPQIVIADPSEIAFSEPVASATNQTTAVTGK